MNAKKISEAMNEIDGKYVDESINYKRKSIKHSWAKWGSLAAACLVLITTSVIAMSDSASDNNPVSTDNNSVAQIEQLSPASDSPVGMRKMINYGGMRYAFLENGAIYNLSAEQLGEVLGILEYDIQANPQENAQKEFSATYALGGTVYKMADYNAEFRVAVEWEGNYYICQRTGFTDNTAMDVSKYFEKADFPNAIEKILICDHAGKANLGEISEKEAFVNMLTQVSPVKLSGEQYQEIAEAQNSGKSFMITFELKDSTRYGLYVIPSLNIAMVGDNRYTLPQEFADEFGSMFDGLNQQPLPAQ